MTHDATSPTDAAGPDADGAALEALMGRLRGLADHVDGPPPLVTDLARAAFETRDFDAELAVLTADSDVDTLALVRSGETTTAPRMVSFEAHSVTVELQLDRQEIGMAVAGLVLGPVESVELETADGRTPVILDGRGWFRLDAVAAQHVRLRVRTGAGTVVTTEWLRT
ncbi:MAG: hypothetical protein ABJA16_02170 [Nakamurella sp.]